MGTGELRRWKSELEILCLNELTGFGYAKDYDAVVTVACDGRRTRPSHSSTRGSQRHPTGTGKCARRSKKSGMWAASYT